MHFKPFSEKSQQLASRKLLIEFIRLCVGRLNSEKYSFRLVFYSKNKFSMLWWVFLDDIIGAYEMDDNKRLDRSKKFS